MMLGLLFTVLGALRADGLLAALNRSLAASAADKLDDLRQNWRHKVAPTGLVAIALALGLAWMAGIGWADLIAGASPVAEVLRGWLPEGLSTPRLPSHLVLGGVVLVAGAVALALSTAALVLVLVLSRLHPFGAIGLVGLALDIQGVACSLGVIVGVS
jgi:hypothetical protein